MLCDRKLNGLQKFLNAVAVAVAIGRDKFFDQKASLIALKSEKVGKAVEEAEKSQTFQP